MDRRDRLLEPALEAGSATSAMRDRERAEQALVRRPLPLKSVSGCAEAAEILLADLFLEPCS